jgi:hypothetical protein
MICPIYPWRRVPYEIGGILRFKTTQQRREENAMRKSLNHRDRFLALGLVCLVCLGFFAMGCATHSDIRALDERVDGAEATAQRALDNAQQVVDTSARHSAEAAESADSAEKAAVRAENAAASARNAAERAEEAAKRCETLYRRIMSK